MHLAINVAVDVATVLLYTKADTLNKNKSYALYILVSNSLKKK